MRVRVRIDFNQEQKAVLWTQNPESAGQQVSRSAGQQVSRSAGQQVSKVKKQQIRRAGLTVILGNDA
ncbi:hypothetical protein GC087_08805 [Pantoea sp. JZ2]|uniref:hypothetical protein n=1 Tax=Pantoea sp. JZ2 TaxID=2654189 RepID=UPI002B4A249C|nr:hypothetical protein [Pantoea sp. JZ2]WRH12710.1 hypothetical protein GC087_08805 [Pantoea sp. JZ2]